MTNVIGVDASVAHGAIVQLTHHIDLQVKYVWSNANKRLDFGLSLRDPLYRWVSFAQTLVEKIDNEPVDFIVIDWDPKTVFWAGNKLTASQLAFVQGYLASGLKNPILWASPSELRRWLDLPLKAPKEKVWETLSLTEMYTKKEDPQGDIRDAIALAMYGHHILTNKK